MGVMTSGKLVYPSMPERHGRIYYRCPCGAAVSCHPGTGIPAGRPASGATRRLRYLAHEAFDPIWRGTRKVGVATGHARKKAYRWLARELGIDPGEAHIGWFNAETCQRVIEICRMRRGEPA